MLQYLELARSESLVRPQRPRRRTEGVLGQVLVDHYEAFEDGVEGARKARAARFS
jgi:hypothetical protein